ncbi:hypothetical protein GMRT_23220 [Giardia muris]|uniref:Uncharacterized protein n=1 Tax=Giardia muris TaxID=5742 RepID=A0A4Z1SP92_GIAMU|nr:hypothetical protein GMRT_23220 [Giardia muris]|eukprot:TNJ27626.1 hypothetical protein GMRT_23220 [Giardia muris]
MGCVGLQMQIRTTALSRMGPARTARVEVLLPPISCSTGAVMTRHRSLGVSSARRLPVVLVLRRPRMPSPLSMEVSSTSVAIQQMEEKRTAGRAPTPRTPSRARSASTATTLPPLLPSSVRSAPSSTVDPVQTARTSARPASTASRGIWMRPGWLMGARRPQRASRGELWASRPRGRSLVAVGCPECRMGGEGEHQWKAGEGDV